MDASHECGELARERVNQCGCRAGLSALGRDIVWAWPSCISEQGVQDAALAALHEPGFVIFGSDAHTYVSNQGCSAKFCVAISEDGERFAVVPRR